jgi:hypothetical protein
MLPKRLHSKPVSEGLADYRATDRLVMCGRGERSTISPESWERLKNEWQPGGCVISVHDSTQADNWINAHYDSKCVKRFRSRGFGGPLASMLSLQSQALTVFGEVSLGLIKLAKDLANVSGFPVIIRPRVDDPIARFRSVHCYRDFLLCE